MSKVLEPKEEVKLDRDAEKVTEEDKEAKGEVKDGRVPTGHNQQDVNHVEGEESDDGEEEELVRKSAGSK
jgi:hypothetical protein